VFVALVIQLAIRMRRIVICGLSGSTVFYILSQNGTFLEESNTKQNARFVFSTTFALNISHSKKN
jgi:tRNA A22 N-methylase